MNVSDLQDALTEQLPAFTITCGEEAEGVWVRADRVDMDWNWERRRMISADAAYELTIKALSNV